MGRPDYERHWEVERPSGHAEQSCVVYRGEPPGQVMLRLSEVKVRKGGTKRHGVYMDITLTAAEGRRLAKGLGG